MTSQMPTKPIPLEPSPLGTKEYWDKLYTTEISNHASNSSDIGTIWFDDSSAEDKILAFLHSPDLHLDLNTTSFLDLGTGNGHFLVRLREHWPPTEDLDSNSDDGESQDEKGEGKENAKGMQKNTGIDLIDGVREHMVMDGKESQPGGFRGLMVGTDYSLPSINFANQLASSRRHDGISSSPPIFKHHDILHSSPSTLLEILPNPKAGYDVVLDKGTFDAISLSSLSSSSSFPSSFPSPSRIEDVYVQKILPLVRIGGLFLITSCNWTKEEICAWFGAGREKGNGKGEEEGLRFVAEIEYPRFRFGGRVGQAVCTVCFRRGG